MPLLNVNDHKSHWSKKANITSTLRMTARNLACNIPPLGKVKIRAILYPPDNRRRDSPNALFATSKPLIDGIVDAGVLSDDNDRVVKSLELMPGDHVVRGGQVVLEIEEIG